MKLGMRKGALATAASLALALAGFTAVGAGDGSSASAASDSVTEMRLPGGFKHLVVIYEENHSFDNLYGSWGSVNGQHVEGLADATAGQISQVAQDGTPYSCLLQNDVNLASPPLPASCQDPAHGIAGSNFTNSIFTIDDYIKATDNTCPAPGTSAPNGVPKDSPGAQPGGCTRDLVHRFYQEQYQLDGGRQDRYTTGSDAVGLTQGVYDTKALPIYHYLHGNGAPQYVIADHFFQGAFGGSFLNHQWLIAARAPVVDPTGAIPPGKLRPRNSILDSNGMPTSYPLYTATGPVLDGELTQKCADPTVNDPEQACGDFAVNTVQPSSRPYSDGASSRFIPLIDDSVYPNIGDRLTDAGISWNWYSGGWDDAAAGNPGPLFQYHHQPFNYFADYAPGQPGRAHLQDETDFIRAAKTGRLPTVSFVKPYGQENEHPGYTGESAGSSHLVDLIQAVMKGSAGDTLILVTYDEFGGQWDHVPPPGMGTPGVHDAWGPGTRIPALLISRSFSRSGVDHTVYDTTSILTTIEHSFGLDPLATRDAQVSDLTAAIRAGRP
jgi:acid phosphatase